MPGVRRSKTVAAREAPAGMEQSGEVFDRATRLAKALFGAVAAQITLIDPEGVWRSGTTREPVKGDAVGVRLAIATGEILWIEDATRDPRFSGEAVVKGPPYLKFFAGAPIKLEGGDIPGVIWVAGSETRPYDATLAERLDDLAAFVADEWTRVRAKRAREAARRESDVAQRMVSSIIQSAPLSLVMTDRDLNIISASPRWVEARQLQGQVVIGRPLVEMVPDAERWTPVYQRVLAGEDVKASRVELRRPDGVVVWLQAELTAWREERPHGQHVICEPDGSGPIDTDRANRVFWQPMRGTNWCLSGSRNWFKVGFHTYRHSFASNLAAAGVDQRLIDEFMGHQTEAMRKRYRHLLPDQRQQAVQSAFARLGQ